MNPFLGYCLSAALVGSLPTGAVFARLRGQSLFSPGKRQAVSIGETFRILGRPLGLLVTLIDFGKGLFVVWPLMNLIFPAPAPHPWWLVSLGGILAVISHCNSPWLGFRGGRGLATSFGVLVYVLPAPTLLALVVWSCLSFWGLSTRPGALSAAGALPLLTILWVVTLDRTRMNYLFLVAFLSLWTLWEQRISLLGYLGRPSAPPESHHDDGVVPTQHSHSEGSATESSPMAEPRD